MREREEGKSASKLSFNDPRSFVGRNLSSQEPKFIASTRATCGYQKRGISSKIQGGDLGESNFSGLGGVLETSFCSTMLQEVGIFPTLVLFPSYGLILGGTGVLRACLADFLTVYSCFYGLLVAGFLARFVSVHGMLKAWF